MSVADFKSFSQDPVHGELPLTFLPAGHHGLKAVSLAVAASRQ